VDGWWFSSGRIGNFDATLRPGRSAGPPLGLNIRDFIPLNHRMNIQLALGFQVVPRSRAI
jgi:hypothetical protein